MHYGSFARGDTMETLVHTTSKKVACFVGIFMIDVVVLGFLKEINDSDKKKKLMNCLLWF